MKKVVTILLVLLTLGAVYFAMTRKQRNAAALEDLYLRSSDAAKVKRWIHIAGDDWLGYLVCRSPLFAQALSKDGIGVKFDMVLDFDARVKGLSEGKYQFSTITLDSYLAQGGKYQWPGVLLWTIDESHGGDAIIGVPPVKTIDDLNNATGAYTASSPSEFLLRSQIANFQLENLRKRMPEFATDSVDLAYQKLKTGKVNFAVLWEPFKTRALQEIPNAQIVIDTTQAQGLIIDVFLASRTVIANDPALIEKVAHAYFTTLHTLLNDPTAMTEAALRDINVRDQKKTLEDATEMLRGIHFASLQENIEPSGWTSSANPKLATSTVQLSRILQNQGTMVNLPNSDPNGILYRKTTQDLQNIPKVVNEAPRLSALYPPLSPSQWDDLAKKVKGTLLDTPIVFRPGQSEIPEETQNELLDAVPKLVHYPSYRIIVQAHSYGNTPEVDQELSAERATEVKRFLVYECHIPEDRVLAVGKGSAEPLLRGPSENESAYARRNRRAKILLVGD